MKDEERQARAADGIGNDEVGIQREMKLKHDYPIPEYSML
jgi:hypothetical protein